LWYGIIFIILGLFGILGIVVLGFTGNLKKLWHWIVAAIPAGIAILAGLVAIVTAKKGATKSQGGRHEKIDDPVTSVELAKPTGTNKQGIEHSNNSILDKIRRRHQSGHD
jgi:hypothetical protein